MGILVILLGVAIGASLAGARLVAVSHFWRGSIPVALGGLQCRYQ